jgi:hypothetical protein
MRSGGWIEGRCRPFFGEIATGAHKRCGEFGKPPENGALPLHRAIKKAAQGGRGWAFRSIIRRFRQCGSDHAITLLLSRLAPLSAESRHEARRKSHPFDVALPSSEAAVSCGLDASRGGDVRRVKAPINASGGDVHRNRQLMTAGGSRWL